jgi:hypothetical protein
MYDCYKGLALGRYSSSCCSTNDDSCSNAEQNGILFWNNYGMLICVFCTALNSAVLSAADPASKTNHFFHQLLLVIFGGFSGGVLCPLVLSRTPMLLTNDYSLLWCTSALILTHYLPCSPAIMRWLLAKPVRLVWNNLLMVTRSSTIFAITKIATGLIMDANGALQVSAAEMAKADSGAVAMPAVPLFGPVLAGVLVSCMGVFFPLTKGTKPISNGMPLVIQGALITSAFYHLYVHDSGNLGAWLRRTVHCLCSLAHYAGLVASHLLAGQLGAAWATTN